MKVGDVVKDFRPYVQQAAKLTLELIRFKSETDGDYEEVMKFAAEVCQSISPDVRIVGPSKSKSNVLAKIPGQGGGPSLLLNGHLDVVPVSEAETKKWKVDPYGGTMKDGAVWGRGAVDMKGQVACMVVAAQILKDLGVKLKGDLTLGFTGDEEVNSDHTGAGYLVFDLGLKWDYCLVGEASNMNIVRYHKGVNQFRLTTRGSSFHAGYPEKGNNAILHMVKLLDAIQNHRFEHNLHPVVGTYSLNIGTIRGGARVNMIPDFCEAEFDVRSVSGQNAQMIEAETRAIIDELKRQDPRFDADVVTFKQRVALDYPEHFPLFGLTEAAVEAAIGRRPEHIGAIANSDAQHFRRAGIPTLWIGPGTLDQNAHAENEHITLEQLEQGIRFFTQSCLTICGVA